MKIEEYIKIRLKELEEKTKNNQELIDKIKKMNLKLLEKNK